MAKKEHKLPKPAATATDDELLRYAGQFDPMGDRRVLAEEILRLRKIALEIACSVKVDGLPLTVREIEQFEIRLPTPVKEEKASKQKDEDC